MPKMRFPFFDQHQGPEKESLMLVARPWAPQAVFQLPVSVMSKQEL